MKKLFFIAALLAAPMFLVAQNTTGLDPAALLKPLSDQWPSYSGDNTGKRYSALKQINSSTVKDLSLQWVNTGITTACGPDGKGEAGAGEVAFPPARGGRGFGGASSSAPIIVGGFGDGSVNTCGPTRFGGGILFVNGILYGASQNDVYAIDARDGSVLWHYYWKYRGGTTTGTRGPSMWHNLIFFELHDDWVVALNATTGQEVWKKEIAPFEMQYFSSNAPMVIGDHVIVGTGNDTDEPAYIKVPRSGNRRGAVEIVFHGAEGGRSFGQDLANAHRSATRRRHILDSRLLRSGDAPVFVRHRKPHSGLYAGARRRRQSLHLVPAGGER